MSDLDFALNILGYYDGSATSFSLRVREVAPDAITPNGTVSAFYRINGMSPEGSPFMVTVSYDEGTRINVKIKGTSPTDDGKDAAKATIDKFVESAGIVVVPVISAKKVNGAHGTSQF